MIKHKPNSIDYRVLTSPTVIVCIDGGSPEYIEKAVEVGKAPTFKKFMENGFYAIASSVIPSYTNPNNIAIVTGTFPVKNGIVGNWFYNRKTKKRRK